MRKIFSLLSLAVIAAIPQTYAQTTIRIYDTALFYDGYAALSDVRIMFDSNITVTKSFIKN